MQTPQDRQRVYNRFCEPSSRDRYGERNISAFTDIFSRKVSNFELSHLGERSFYSSGDPNFEEVRLRETLMRSMKLKKSNRYNNQLYSPGSSMSSLSVDQ